MHTRLKHANQEPAGDGIVLSKGESMKSFAGELVNLMGKVIVTGLLSVVILWGALTLVGVPFVIACLIAFLVALATAYLLNRRKRPKEANVR